MHTCSVQGAEAPLSGLIAMLAAAEVLGNSGYADVYRRRLIFTAFAGEPWGSMGSKRFLWELHSHENSTRGLMLDQIQQARLYTSWHNITRQGHWCNFMIRHGRMHCFRMGIS